MALRLLQHQVVGPRFSSICTMAVPTRGENPSMVPSRRESVMCTPYLASISPAKWRGGMGSQAASMDKEGKIGQEDDQHVLVLGRCDGSRQAWPSDPSLSCGP